MAFTRAQWEQLQNRLPVEDRATFEEYLKSQGLTTAPATPLAAAEGGLIAAQSMESQTTGVTAPLTPSGPGKKPGKAWVLKDGNWAQPDKPTDDGLMEITDQRKLSNGKISQQTRTIVYEWNDSLGWRKRYTYERLVTDDPKAAEALAEAAKVAKEAAEAAAKAERDRKFAARPGTAWQWNEATTEWVQPKSPGAGYTWDDNFGWQLPKTSVSTSVTTTGVVTSVTTTGIVTSAVTTKTYTREEWEAFQASLPPEDRMSYEDYLASLRISATTTGVVTSVSTTGVATSVTTTGVVTSVTTTGVATSVSTAAATAATTSTVTPTVIDTQLIGSGTNRVIRTYYSNGTYTDIASPETTLSNATSDPAMISALAALQSQNTALLAQMQSASLQANLDAKAAAEAAAKEKQENAILVLTNRFNRYGLASLVPKITELARSGANESTITLQLQETDEYKLRFKANEDRRLKGLSVLDPGDYLALEDDYRQILRAYGLKQFDTDAYVQQFISNDISTTELSNRVVTAVQRVQNADPAILTTLRSFYGITDNDLVAYVLDPNQQFQKIERQVAAAEIGSAAKLQGINAGVTVSEQLAAQGVTKAQAQKGYSTIADILPTAEKLSDIYKGTLDEYRLGEAEQEVFNTLASAQRKRQKLVEREIASFSGTSGVGRGSLSTQTGGQI